MARTQLRQVRRAEIVAVLALATDLAMGRPVEFAWRSCVLAVRLGKVLGFDAPTLAEVYWQSLLRYIGCNAETHVLAALFGDEIDMRRDFALVDMGSGGEMLRFLIRNLGRASAGATPVEMARRFLLGLVTARTVSEGTIAGHCDVAARLAERLGFNAATTRNLGQIYARFDGRGWPAGLRGEAIAPAVRLVTLVQDFIALADAYGAGEALAIVGRRRGGAYDPAIVDRLANHGDVMLVNLDEHGLDAVLALEPAPQSVLGEGAFDEACLAMADFIDLKSPYTLGHSRAVAAMAEEAARVAGLPDADAVLLRRAGLLHDLGMAGVPASIWSKPGKLSDREREEVRLHPYHTERILARPPALDAVASVAGQHHERLDGSGYHRGIKGAAQSAAARILAAAEAYRSMREARPHRPARTDAYAANELKREVREGRLDGNAVAAVLTAAGHEPPRRRSLVSDLTPREMEVLGLLAAGLSMKEVARKLGVAPKTVDNHIQHLYAKIGVTTRAGAILFAVEHGFAGT